MAPYLQLLGMLFYMDCLENSKVEIKEQLFLLEIKEQLNQYE